jgi:hypothetical protein
MTHWSMTPLRLIATKLGRPLSVQISRGYEVSIIWIRICIPMSLTRIRLWKNGDRVGGRERVRAYF